MSDTNGCRVITIAFADGAHAPEIGRQVALDLGFRYVDDQIIERAAALTRNTRERTLLLERAAACGRGA